MATPPGKFASNAPAKVEGDATNQAMIAPAPATGFRLVRYFTVASLAAFALFAAALLYFARLDDDFHKKMQQEQDAFFAQVQDSFVKQQDATARRDLLTVHEAGIVNLTRLFANALWEKDFAPFVAKAQRIPVGQCRAIADVKDAGGKTVQPAAKKTCYAGIGRQIMAFPGFRALDARVFGMMKKSTVFKIKVYDLRGITVYSSEHNQIGEDQKGNAGWQSAVVGKPASELIHRDKFNAFDGVVENRDLIEIYLPVLAPGSDKIVGVFETYSDVTPFLEQIKNTSAQIGKLRAENQAQVERAAAANETKVDANADLLLAIVLGLLVLFYCALFLIVRHGQRIIDRQDSERRWAELALARQKDLYNMLSQTNQAIVRITSREEMFPAVCRIAVAHGRFRFAWIGLIGKEDQRVKLVAKYGEDAGYLDQMYISADESDAAGRGPTGQALRAGEHAVSNDFLNDPATAPWHEAARRAGVRASAALPIRQGGAVIGAINLYAGEPGFFTEDVLATLGEMAIDVSYALDHFAIEAARKQAEVLLTHNEQRLRSILQTSMDSFWIVDIEGRFLEVNDAYCRLIGYPREEILKMRVHDVEAMESPEDTARHMREVMAKGYDRFETRHRRKDGQVVDVEVSVNVISEREGERFFVFMRDITERKRAEEALRAAEDQFRGLVEQSIAGIYIIQDGKFAYVNPRFAEILGYDSADELIGSDPLSTVAEKDRGVVAENNRRRLAGEVRSISYSLTSLRKDGSTVEVGVHGTRATYRGRPAIIGLMQDISEKKRAEDEIKRYVAQLENTFMHAVEIATTLSEMRDPYTAGHERRVGEIAAAIGAALGFDARRVEGLRVAGYLHDVGKITIPAEILAKPGKISPTEFLLIKEHARASYDILKNVEFPWPVAEVALQHHERMDGSGYPQGLKGEAILLEARIMAVADVVEAMASHRPYRPALGIDKALAEIERGRGTVYDPDVAKACLRLFREQGYAIPA